MNLVDFCVLFPVLLFAYVPVILGDKCGMWFICFNMLSCFWLLVGNVCVFVADFLLYLLQCILLIPWIMKDLAGM